MPVKGVFCSFRLHAGKVKHLALQNIFAMRTTMKAMDIFALKQGYASIHYNPN